MADEFEKRTYNSSLKRGRIKEYRGIRWEEGNDTSLSIALGKAKCAFNSYKRGGHPDATHEDYIDFILNKMANKERKIKEYRGIKWRNELDLDVLNRLNIPSDIYTDFKGNFPNSDMKDFIDYVLGKRDAMLTIEISDKMEDEDAKILKRMLYKYGPKHLIKCIKISFSLVINELLALGLTQTNIGRIFNMTRYDISRWNK